MSLFEQYPCVGVCTDDPDSGYCLGCGRPPASEEPPAVTQPAIEDIDDVERLASITIPDT